MTDLQLWNLTQNFESYSVNYGLTDQVTISDKFTGTFVYGAGKLDTKIYYLCFRGTDIIGITKNKSFWEMMKDLMIDTFAWKVELGTSKIKVHAGFYFAFQSVERALWDLMKSIQDKGYDKVVLLGHSLGGAVSLLALKRMVFENYWGLGEYNIRCVTFGSPKVGNRLFYDDINKVAYKSYEYGNDVVTKLPPFYAKSPKVCQIGTKRKFLNFNFSDHVNYGKEVPDSVVVDFPENFFGKVEV